jgi:PAS domain S-box-containing protein
MRRRAWTFVALWAVAGLFILCVWLIAASVNERRRFDAIEQGRSQAALAVVGAETVLNRTFLSIDVLLAGLEDLVGPDLRRSQDDRAQVALAGIVKRNLVVRDVVLLNEQGEVLASAIPATRRIGLKLPAGLLTNALAVPVPALSVSQPADNFVTAETVYFFARRFDKSTGGPVVAVAVVPEAQVSGALSPGGLLPSLTITLERSDGQLVASNPPTGLPAATRIAQPIRAEFRDGIARTSLGRVGGAPAVVAARSLLQEGLVVAATLPLSAVLKRAAEDQRNVHSVAVLAGLLVLLTAAVTQAYLLRMDRARRDIERSRDLLDQALASMRDGFLLCDASGAVVAWNARYLEFFPWVAEVIAPGVRFEQLLQLSVDKLFPNSDESERAARLQHRLEEHRRGHTSSEYQIGPELWLNVVETRTAAGGVVSVYRDVTSTERELSRAREAEQAATDARAHFVNAVSQQIAQPANNVLGMSELLLRAKPSEPQKHYIVWARESAQQILAALDSLAQLSRLQADAVPKLDFAELDARQVVHEAVSYGERHGRGRGQVVLSFGQGLPRLLWGDPVRMQQAIGALVRGVAECCEGQTVDVRVRHEPRQEGSVHLVVTASSDRGARHIMDALEDSAAGTAGAVAMQTAHRLAKLLGGRLAVSDVIPGESWRVTLEIPAATVASAADESRQDAPA